MSNKNYFLNGITDLLILFLLSKGDKYVYEINRTIEEMSGGLLKLSQNTIYTATYKLEMDKMITEYTKLVGRKRTRVYYHIEEKGKNYLDELSKAYKATTDGIFRILNSDEKTLHNDLTKDV